MRGLAGALAAVTLLAAACNPLQSSTAATSARTGSAGAQPPQPTGVLDPGVAMPAGFPTDFPVYTRARLTAAASFASNGQVVWGMEWETLDAQAKVQGFYTKQLNQGDWILNPPSAAAGKFAATFARKSDKNVQGTVAAGWNGTMTKILVSLVAPA